MGTSGWHHIAVLYSSSATSVTVFLDGTQKGKTSVNLSSKTTFITALGGNGGSSKTLVSMAQVAIYQAFLSDAEINNIKGKGTIRVSPHTELNGSVFLLLDASCAASFTSNLLARSSWHIITETVNQTPFPS